MISNMVILLTVSGSDPLVEYASFDFNNADAGQICETAVGRSSVSHLGD